METEFTYPFDYTLYQTDEIAALIELVDTFEKVQSEIPKNASLILKNYELYRSILSNQAEEKRCDQIFRKELGFSVYETVKEAKKYI